MFKLLNVFTDFLAQEKQQKIFFQIFLICFIGISFYSSLVTSGCITDTAEHIHASYLVSLGKIPYRDFFEHHNPLLWYLFVPITKIFYRNPLILPVAQGIAVCGNLAVVWLIYKINERFIYGTNAAKLSLFILISVPYLWQDILTFRPDIFMLLCFFGAVYYFLDYLVGKSRIKLILSYSLLGLSFLFLQKIVILGLAFLGVNLYYLHLKKIRLTDFILAVVCGSFPLILFFSYFFYNGALNDWFYYNFTFNILMKKYFDGFTCGVELLLLLWCFSSFFIILRYYKWERCLIWLILFYLLSLVITVLFAPHIWYFSLYCIFASILLGKILLKAKYFKFIYLCLVFFSFTAIFIMFPSEKSKIRYFKRFNDLSAILKYTDENEPIICLTKDVFLLFNPAPSYHWFGFQTVAIIDTIYTPQRKFDLMSELKNKPTNFICYEKPIMWPILYDEVIFEKSKYFMRRNSAIVTNAAKNPDLVKKVIMIDSDFWKIDEEWIKRNYEQIEGTVVWKRKM